MVTCSYSRLRLAGLVYGCLPVGLFLVFWLKPAIGMPSLVVLVAALLLCAGQVRGASESGAVFPSPFERCFGARGAAGGERSISLRASWLIVIAAIVLAWCVLGGQGGMWYQSGDWDSRNALFRDLITHGWPVRYSSDGGWLCYYVGHWLPAAAVGKAALRLGLGLSVAWRVANVALLLWTACGVVIAVLLALVTVRPLGAKGVFACVAVFILFSTPDLAGAVATGRLGPVLLEQHHMEWWASNMQFSSITTCLFWVFNQSVIPWVCTLLFVNERAPSSYFPIWLSCLFAGPLPSIGLALLMATQGVAALAEGGGERAHMLKSAASVQNALVLPVIALVAVYFLSTSATTGELSAEWAQHNLLPKPFYLPSDGGELVRAVVFVLVEGLLIPSLLALAKVRGPLLVSATLVLVVCPFVRFNTSADFCMRASIPALLVLCVLCMRVLVCALGRKPDARASRMPAMLLAIVLAVGTFTPAVEFFRGFGSVALKGVEASLNDSFVTFEGKDGWPRTNFVVKDGGEGEPLFERIAGD